MQALGSARRCGWLEANKRGKARIVWARGDCAIDECPKSYIRPESLGWLEAYAVWRLGGRAGLEDREAREVEAFVLLERLSAAEMRNGIG